MSLGDLRPDLELQIASLSEHLFKARLELIQQLDSIEALGDERAEAAVALRQAIASMNQDNFLVRPHLELVERFRKEEAWESVSIGDQAAMAEAAAALPDQLDPEHEDAKRFDILLPAAQQACCAASHSSSNDARSCRSPGCSKNSPTSQ